MDLVDGSSPQIEFTKLNSKLDAADATNVCKNYKRVLSPTHNHITREREIE